MLGSGQILQVEPGSGRLLGLLSMQHLMRRLTLDFRDVIGKGGSVIRALTEETGTTINVEDDGTVTISSPDMARVAEARRRIEEITADVEVGKIYEGPVVKLLDFGAIIGLLPGKDGLLHISQIANERVNQVSDYLQEGQTVRVKVIGFDDKNRPRLSMKALLNEE